MTRVDPLDRRAQGHCTNCGRSIWKGGTGQAGWITWTGGQCCDDPEPGPPGWMYDRNYRKKVSQEKSPRRSRLVRFVRR